MNRTGEIMFLHDLFDVLNFPNPGVQLVQIWAGIEFIVRSKGSVRKSIRSRCAMLLRNTEKEQEELCELIDTLYDFRCDLVHGNKSFELKEYQDGLPGDGKKVSGKTRHLFDSYDILRELVKMVIEDGEMPDKKELEELQSEFESVGKSD